MKKRKIFTCLAIAAGLFLTVKAGQAIYWNSLSPDQKVEKMTEKMGRWLSLTDEQKPRVLELNRALLAEKGDPWAIFQGGGHCRQADAATDPAVQKWRDGMREVLTDEQEKKLHF